MLVAYTVLARFVRKEDKNYLKKQKQKQKQTNKQTNYRLILTLATYTRQDSGQDRGRAQQSYSYLVGGWKISILTVHQNLIAKYIDSRWFVDSTQKRPKRVE